jgi:hypothetical protein
MISLYDYLEKAAGMDLGKQVSDYAKIRKAKVGTRNVSNRKYSGIVHLYEKEFLEEFFAARKLFIGNKDYIEINTLLEQDSLNEGKII